MKPRLSTALAFLYSWGAAWAGQAGPVSLTWSELGPRITGNKVALVLPDGTSVQGEVREVEPAGLRLDVSKTSNKRAQPKGLHTIPRQSVSVLQLIEYRRLGRLLFTLGGAATAAAIAYRGIRDTGVNEGPMIIVLPVVGAAGTAGVGIGSYYFGRAVDKRVTLIRVVPGG